MHINTWERSIRRNHQPLTENGYVALSQKHIDLSCEAAAEGMVLLKNNGALPLKKGTPLALLGKGTYDYVKGGGGSGDVFTSHIRNIAQGIEALAPGFTYEPLNEYYRSYVQNQLDNGIAGGMMAEPELPEELLRGAAAYAKVAILSISRFSGESWDRPCGFPCGEEDPWLKQSVEERKDKGVFMEGDFSLTAAERSVLEKATAAFDTVIVLLNVGGVVDTAWIRDNARVDAALLVWQGGMEGGLAAAKLLFGDENPSGKLPDTFPMHISDFPSTANFHESQRYVHYLEDVYVGYRYFETIPGKQERVCYPFGYGLSYTTFRIQCRDVHREGYKLAFHLDVTNTGSVPGKEVVQLYLSAPQGRLGKPARSLIAFQKTALLAVGETERAILHVDLSASASFDDVGVVSRFAWVLEQGTYTFYCGGDVRAAEPVFALSIEEDEVVKQLASELAPTSLPKRLRADGTYETLPCGPSLDRDAGSLPEKWKCEYANHPKIAPEHPPVREVSEDGRILLKDVKEGHATLEAFMAQLTDEELFGMLGGQCSEGGLALTGGLGNLPEYGVPSMMTADGPAGVHLNPESDEKATAFPCATLLAATWNPELVQRLGAAGGAEIKEFDFALWLTPAANIHRNPLCGRNFEYYSEDPVLAGEIGAGMILGIQSNGVGACLKHFACNNKETKRKESDSRLSERALREIYLKVFEIIVKKARPYVVMTSYNIINGRRTSESHELIQDILRDEWGFDGLVLTDWACYGEQYKEVLAGNDVKMPIGFPDRLREGQRQGYINRRDVEKCVERLLKFLMRIN